MTKLPETYEHPTMGTFVRDEHDDYVQLNKRGRSTVELRLNCGYEGRENVLKNLSACEKIAARVHGYLHEFVRDAATTFSEKEQSGVNIVRDIEGKPPISPQTIRRRMRLNDVCVSPNYLTVCFSGDVFNDEHNLFMVRYGPRLGFREAYIY